MARRINLVPPSERARTTTNFGMLALVVAAIVVLGALGLGYFMFKSDLDERKDELAALQQETQALQTQVAALQKYDALASDADKAETTVQGIYAGRTIVSDILDDLSQVMPENVWLQSMHLTTLDPGVDLGAADAVADNSVDLTGKTYSFEDVAQLLVRLQLIPSLADVNLRSAVGSGEVTASDVKTFSVDAVVTPPSEEALLPVSQVEVEGL